ncbi:collagen alpha-1(I) chain-like [Molothrus ater]|uniref:collagen alpha-1(I) chain-like n=1 Tax=Molothrus ater TaxID=84834 RepID=UPI00174D307E|nr:collagen alpha-1(I) chain-like [Molothrus ater]
MCGCGLDRKTETLNLGRVRSTAEHRRICRIFPEACPEIFVGRTGKASRTPRDPEPGCCRLLSPERKTPWAPRGYEFLLGPPSTECPGRLSSQAFPADWEGPSAAADLGAAFRIWPPAGPCGDVSPRAEGPPAPPAAAGGSRASSRTLPQKSLLTASPRRWLVSPGGEALPEVPAERFFPDALEHAELEPPAAPAAALPPLAPALAASPGLPGKAIDSGGEPRQRGSERGPLQCSVSAADGRPGDAPAAAEGDSRPAPPRNSPSSQLREGAAPLAPPPREAAGSPAPTGAPGLPAAQPAIVVTTSAHAAPAEDNAPLDPSVPPLPPPLLGLRDTRGSGRPSSTARDGSDRGVPAFGRRPGGKC